MWLGVWKGVVRGVEEWLGVWKVWLGVWKGVVRGVESVVRGVEGCG